MVDTDDLAKQMDEQARRTLEYGRHRFLWTWLAMALLAVLIAAALEVSVNTAKKQSETVQMTADTANTKADANTASNEEITKYLKGEQGIPGVPGANGKNGAPGQPGSVPSDLPPGPTGPPGKMGSEGPVGPAGALGATGVTGPTGEPGVAGAAGTMGEPGTAGEQGPRGEQGPKGDTGLQGPEGISGPSGAQGPAGPAATPTTAIAINSTANDPAPSKQVTATCTTGRASGGGFAVVPSTAGVVVTASSPVGNTGWSATAEQGTLASGTNWQLLSFAVCLS